jgi:hypothetical protein
MTRSTPASIEDSMDDQKDRFGDKIHDLEKARENQWARGQDRVLLEKSAPGNLLRSVALAAKRN